MPAGRAGEQAAEGLTEALQKLGFQMNRLKFLRGCLDSGECSAR